MSEKPKLDEPGEDTESAPSKASAWKIIGVLAVLAVLAVIGYGAGVVMHAFKPLKGEVNQPSSLSDIITNIGQVAVDPKQGFPEN